MKVSKLVSRMILVMVFAAMANVSFAKAKDHDGEIIAYVQALDNGEVAVSKMAKDKNVDASVNQFADMMIDQHGQNLQQVTDLSSKINVPADETAGVKKFKEKSDKDMSNLSKMTGAQFQKAYIQAMIKGHTEASKMITQFEKEAQNAELKSFLADTEKAVEHHLAEAKKMK